MSTRIDFHFTHASCRDMRRPRISFKKLKQQAQRFAGYACNDSLLQELSVVFFSELSSEAAML